MWWVKRCGLTLVGGGFLLWVFMSFVWVVVFVVGVLVACVAVVVG